MRSFGGVGSRREARERALSLLYEAEAKALTPDEVLDALGDWWSSGPCVERPS